MRKYEMMSELEFIDIFSDNLRELMMEQDMTQLELARKIRVNKSTITRYLNKTTIPSVKAIVNMCVVFDCDVDDLIPTYDLID